MDPCGSLRSRGTIHIDEIRSIAREHNGVTFLGVRSVTQ
jgi:hypothetical protein